MRKFENREILYKTIITIFFVVSFLCAPKVGFLPLGVEGFCLANNILFPLSHANIFHLLCNLWCMWLLRPPYYWVSAIVISFVCSLLPEINHEPIMGASGIIFAIIGARYGVRNNAKRLIRNTWLPFIVMAFMPNVACLYHLYCIGVGFCWGYIKETWRLTRIR